MANIYFNALDLQEANLLAADEKRKIDNAVPPFPIPPLSIPFTSPPPPSPGIDNAAMIALVFAL